MGFLSDNEIVCCLWYLDTKFMILVNILFWKIENMWFFTFLGCNWWKMRAAQKLFLILCQVYIYLQKIPRPIRFEEKAEVPPTPTSECIFNCHLRSHISEKVFAHCLHWYGFSPVCILKCPIGWIFTKDVTLFFLEKLWHNAYTYIWFLFRMYFQMSFKIRYWWKSLCTLPAFIWFLPQFVF